MDSFGFKQVPEFFSHSPLKKVEELLEDDYMDIEVKYQDSDVLLRIVIEHFRNIAWIKIENKLKREIVKKMDEQSCFDIEGTKLIRYGGQDAYVVIPEGVTIIGDDHLSGGIFGIHFAIPAQG